MKHNRLFWIALALALLGAGRGRADVTDITYTHSVSDTPAAEAEVDLVEIYHPSPGAVAGALAINVVYVPVRFALTVVGAMVGGIEGIFSAGDEAASETLWGLFDGSQVITPGMLEGRERWTFSRYGW